VIRLSLLQFRAQAVTAAAALAVVAVTLAVSAPHLFGMYDASGIATCQAHGDCASLATSFVNKLAGFYAVFYFIALGFLFVAPAVIGAFWGAPLVTRELEAGTFQLAWTQSVTRTRWLAARLGLAALTAVAFAGLFSLLLTWWSGPVDTAIPLEDGNSISFIRLGFVLFPTRGITPIGYAAFAFAFALGVAAGVLIRRTLPAMAVTLGVFASVQIVWPIWVRPHLIAPARAVVALTAANIPGLAAGPGGTTLVNPPALPGTAGGWVLSFQIIDPAGRAFNANTIRSCLGQNYQACNNALGRLHLRDVIAYQPASRFWALQWYETGIFLAAAALLAGFCFWSIRSRRLSR
jgi:hypothetical protein